MPATADRRIVCHRRAEMWGTRAAACCRVSSNPQLPDLTQVSRRVGVRTKKQEAQLSQRDRAMLRVIEYFAKSLKVT